LDFGKEEREKIKKQFVKFALNPNIFSPEEMLAFYTD
jgi:hypothetical protein